MRFDGVKAASNPATGTELPSPLEGEGAPTGRVAPGGAGEGSGLAPHARKAWRTGATTKLRGFARSMRTNATEVEGRLWTLVRNRRFVNFKFRRQVPIGRYIVDLMCPSAKLIVELDGSQHADNEDDAARDAWLAGRGYRVLRIWNNDLTQNRGGVLDAIWHALQEARP